MHSPLEQFNIIKWIPLKILGFDISFTNSSFYMIFTALLCILVPYLMIRFKKTILLDVVIDFVRSMTEQYIGDTRYLPMILSLFLFLTLSNLIGIIPGAFTTTSHISVTLFLAVCMYVFVIGCGILKHGFGFFRIFCPKSIPLYLTPIFVPIEIASFLSKPISLAIRLFANMLAGHIMVKLFAGFVIMLNFGLLSTIPIAVNVFLIAFEIFVALLQAYIFTLLTCLYLHDTLNLH